MLHNFATNSLCRCSSETFLISRLCSTSHPSVFVVVIVLLSSRYTTWLLCWLAWAHTRPRVRRGKYMCHIYFNFPPRKWCRCFFLRYAQFASNGWWWQTRSSSSSTASTTSRKKRQLQARNKSIKLNVDDGKSLFFTSFFLHVWSFITFNSSSGSKKSE